MHYARVTLGFWRLGPDGRISPERAKCPAVGNRLDVTDASDDDRGHQRTDPVDNGDCRRRCDDRCCGAFANIDPCRVEDTDLIEHLLDEGRAFG